MTASPESAAPVGAAGPLPESELLTNCFNWPKQNFTKTNYAEVELRLNTGDRAVDFELESAKGDTVRLSSLLNEKPVLLVQGSWTCPRFQAERVGLEALYQRFRNDIHMVIVYNVEAHPGGGDPSPYKGRPWSAEFSDRGQPKTYAERMRNAREIAKDSTMPVVVDKLDNSEANPFWCTYGTCAGCSWLVAKDGTIAAAHRWHDAPTMTSSIEALLGKQAP